MRIYSRTYITGVVTFLMLQGMMAQERKTFTYGGVKGNKYNGAVDVACVVVAGGRTYPLKGLTVDLNQYAGDVKLGVQFTNLQVGLTDSFDKVRNSDHPKVFYLHASSLQLENNVLSIEGNGVVIGAPSGHYGGGSNVLVYTINPIASERDVALRVKAEIVDGVYDQQWNVFTVTKKFTILPRSRNLENELWTQIEAAFKAGDKKALLEKCTRYQLSCDEGAFSDCGHKEDVVFYLISISGGKQKDLLIKEYMEKYPQGKYVAELGKDASVMDTGEPIQPGLARLDFDEVALLINEIKGGVRPYYASFFDYAKNKEYPIKSVRFNKESILLELESVGVPEGFYTVKVTDGKGAIFVEKENVRVRETLTIPPSVKLGGILLVVGGLIFVYKKYIHF
jgi:hypothetical protein